MGFGMFEDEFSWRDAPIGYSKTDTRQPFVHWLVKNIDTVAAIFIIGIIDSADLQEM